MVVLLSLPCNKLCEALVHQEKRTIQGLLVTDLAHLGRQLAEVTLLLTHLCLLLILSSFFAADHLVPYRRAKISVSNDKDHARSEALCP